jgi:hypothetical protein
VPVLIIRERAGIARVHTLKGLLNTIGRDAGCHVVLPHADISRRHARLSKLDGAWTLEDLDAPNGTLLNDQPVKKALLEHGDVIRIGRFRLEYQIEDRLDEQGLLELQRLNLHGRAPAAQEQSTYVLSPAMREKLLRTEKVRDLLVLAREDDGALSWRPEGRSLSIGPRGDVPARQLFRSSPVAVLEWDGARYQIQRRGFCGRVELNGKRVQQAPVKPGDRLQVGQDRFVLLEEEF